MDGVLIDTEKWLNKYWRQAAAEAGYDMTVEDGLAIRSLAAKYAAPFLQKRFGADFPYWTIRERRKELMKAHIAANGIDKSQVWMNFWTICGRTGLRRRWQLRRIRRAQRIISPESVSTISLTVLCAQRWWRTASPSRTFISMPVSRSGKRLRTVLRSKIPQRRALRNGCGNPDGHGAGSGGTGCGCGKTHRGKSGYTL